MSGEVFVKELCEEKHKEIENKIRGCRQWIAEHETKIDTLEKSNSAANEKFNNLIRRMDSLTKVSWWVVGLMGTSLVGFFFVIIEDHLMKGGI